MSPLAVFVFVFVFVFFIVPVFVFSSLWENGWILSIIEERPGEEE